MVIYFNTMQEQSSIEENQAASPVRQTFPKFSFKQKLAHLALEFPPLERGLQHRADNFITTTGIENYLEKGGLYLDVGIGRGHIVQRILEVMANKGKSLKGYFGIDIGDKPHRKVQRRELERQMKETSDTEEKKISQKNPIGFAWATAERLPFAGKSFDGISLIFSLHHMSEDTIDAVIQEAKRVIKADGYIFVAEDIPETEGERKFTEDMDRRNNLERRNAQHYYKSDQEWEEYFKEKGFEVVNKKDFKTKYNESFVRHGFYALKIKRP